MIATEVSKRLTKAEAGNKPGHAWDEEHQEFIPLGMALEQERLAKPMDLQANLEAFTEARKVVLKFIGEQMREAEYDEKGYPISGKLGDYYKVPGAGDKKALTKKGAENLAQFFRFFAGPLKVEQQTTTKEYVDATVSGTIVDHFGRIVGSAVSSCSSAETAYQTFGSKQKYGGWYERSSKTWKRQPDYRAAMNDVMAKARKRWFVQGIIVATATDEIFELAQDEVVKEETETVNRPKRMPFGKHEGEELRTIGSEFLVNCVKWCETRPKYAELMEACLMELEDRRENQEGQEEIDF